MAAKTKGVKKWKDRRIDTRGHGSVQILDCAYRNVRIVNGDYWCRGQWLVNRPVQERPNG